MAAQEQVILLHPDMIHKHFTPCVMCLCQSTSCWTCIHYFHLTSLHLQAVATLAAHIWKVARASQGTTVGLPHKRNSELINSLLGINKMMNEAGRR